MLGFTDQDDDGIVGLGNPFMKSCACGFKLPEETGVPNPLLPMIVEGC